MFRRNPFRIPTVTAAQVAKYRELTGAGVHEARAVLEREALVRAAHTANSLTDLKAVVIALASGAR